MVHSNVKVVRIYSHIIGPCQKPPWLTNEYLTIVSINDPNWYYCMVLHPFVNSLMHYSLISPHPS